MIRFDVVLFSLNICVYLCILQKFTNAQDKEDVDLNAVELIKKYGYPVETYSDVITEDKYLLDIYRIPNKKSKAPPILLIAGVGRTSRDYVSIGPKAGLAYLLADRGYDVWLGNVRGSEYSRKHLTLNPDTDPQFWNFSWHEIGIYDLPAIFKLMRKVTKKERFAYIGMSQGTTVFYALTSKRPEYNKNVTVMISLAPVAYMNHFFSPILKLLAAFVPILTPMLRGMGIHEVPPPPMSELLRSFNRMFCTSEGYFQDLCVEILQAAAGSNGAQLNKSLIPIVVGRGPSAGLRELYHHGQNINSGLFREYDFGRQINMEKYGNVFPPSYNLSEITAPVALVYSKNDWLANPKDVHRLCRELPNCMAYKVPLSQFTHYDYVLARDVVPLSSERVFRILEQFNKT